VATDYNSRSIAEFSFLCSVDIVGFREITCLQNIEMSGNLTAVWEKCHGSVNNNTNNKQTFQTCQLTENCHNIMHSDVKRKP